MTNRAIASLGCLLALSLAGCGELLDTMANLPGACQVAPTGGEACGPGPRGGGAGPTGGTTPGGGGGTTRGRLELVDTRIDWKGVNVPKEWELDAAGGTATWTMDDTVNNHHWTKKYDWSIPPAQIPDYGTTFEYQTEITRTKVGNLLAIIGLSTSELVTTPAAPPDAQIFVQGVDKLGESPRQSVAIGPKPGVQSGTEAIITIALDWGGPRIAYVYRY